MHTHLPYLADNDPAHTLDLYLPATSSSKPFPLIIWIHGGGWNAGSKSNASHLRSFIERGYAAASVEYRFTNKAIFPAQLQDCQAAVRFLRANASKYNLDSNRFGAWGDSAGGHLVALLGLTGGKNTFAALGENAAQSDNVQCVVDYFGPTDFTTLRAQVEADKTVKYTRTYTFPDDPASALIGSDIGKDKEKTQAASPIFHLTKDAPPFLFVHGTKDVRVPPTQSTQLHEALQKLNIESIVQIIPDAPHGGPLFYRPEILNLVQSFFDKHLKDQPIGEIKPLPSTAFSTTPQ